MTLLGPPRRRREHRRFRPPQPPKQPDQHDQEAAARGAICEATMSSNGIHPRSHARSVRPAEALQPNSPSCGNQPANISLTAPSRTNTHATSSAWSGQRSGAREAIRAPLRPAPLTNRPTYQSLPPGTATRRPLRTGTVAHRGGVVPGGRSGASRPATESGPSRW